VNKPFPAYSGTEPYVFVCYAHKDADVVYSDILQLKDQGVNIWYDEGIQAGSSWRAEIAKAITGAKKVVFFISEISLQSNHCLREVHFALDHDIDIVPVYLSDCALPPELELVLSRVHALFRNTDDLYMDHLLGALKERSKPQALTFGRKNKKPGIPVRFVALGLVLLGLIALLVWNAEPDYKKFSADTETATNAFDPYMNGLELLERWDKGDNLDGAIDLFREAISADPDFALAFARLAEGLRLRYILTGDENWLEEAQEKINHAAGLNPELAPVQVALGSIQLMRDDVDLASASFQRGLSIDANNAAAHLGMAKVYQRLGRPDDAKASFSKAMVLDPENLQTLDAYANFLSTRGSYDEAVRQWQTLLRLAPGYYPALVNFGAALEAMGRIPEAILMYERAIKSRPSYMGYSNLGTAYSRGERYADAVEAYRKALEIDDGDWLAWGNLAFVYSWMNGMSSETLQLFSEAIVRAEAAREQNPRDAYIYSDLALYYAKTGQVELALQRLETAVTLSPDSGEIFAAAAEVSETIGNRDRAVEFMSRALELGLPRQQLQRSPDLSELLADPRVGELLSGE